MNNTRIGSRLTPLTRYENGEGRRPEQIRVLNFLAALSSIKFASNLKRASIGFFGLFVFPILALFRLKAGNNTRIGSRLTPLTRYENGEGRRPEQAKVLKQSQRLSASARDKTTNTKGTKR